MQGEMSERTKLFMNLIIGNNQCNYYTIYLKSFNFCDQG